MMRPVLTSPRVRIVAAMTALALPLAGVLAAGQSAVAWADDAVASPPLTATPNVLCPSQAAIAAVEFMSDDGQPIAHRAVTFDASGHAVLSAAATVTGPDGVAAVEVTDDTRETVTVTASDGRARHTTTITFGATCASSAPHPSTPMAVTEPTTTPDAVSASPDATCQTPTPTATSTTLTPATPSDTPSPSVGPAAAPTPTLPTSAPTPNPSVSPSDPASPDPSLTPTPVQPVSPSEPAPSGPSSTTTPSRPTPESPLAPATTQTPIPSATTTPSVAEEPASPSPEKTSDASTTTTQQAVPTPPIGPTGLRLAQSPDAESSLATSADDQPGTAAADSSDNPTITVPDSPAMAPQQVDASQGTPTINGEGAPGTTATVTDIDGTPLCSAVTGADGDWACTPSQPVLMGVTTLTVTLRTDAGLPVETLSLPIHVRDAVTGPTVQVASDTLARGQKQTVTGSGWEPGETVHLAVYTTPLDLGTVTADDDGNLPHTSFTVPKDFDVSKHQVVAIGSASGTRETSFTVTVKASPSPSQLSDEGSTASGGNAPTSAPQNTPANASNHGKAKVATGGSLAPSPQREAGAVLGMGALAFAATIVITRRQRYAPVLVSSRG